MDARKLILTNSFTLRELLRLKTQYLSKKRIVYGRIQKVTEDESFDKFILLIADLSSSGYFIFNFTLCFITVGTFFTDDEKAGLLMLSICLFYGFVAFIYRVKVSRLSFVIVIKLALLRLRMRWYKISPPQIMDD
ncbi:hypothetical protein [Erwinia sorbitola]|uniref:Uncharacterized protein n=1 Tax=Erwinia sorbitola TaxID=2681984 RepID=A0ABW9RHF2_9GAMM|nr:hypothetical protein [Erwinia sorbitola]MTD28935.1 hypothetical protein [Erwinia sorbitola]